jgi:hypothetical protein
MCHARRRSGRRSFTPLFLESLACLCGSLGGSMCAAAVAYTMRIENCGSPRRATRNGAVGSHRSCCRDLRQNERHLSQWRSINARRLRRARAAASAAVHATLEELRHSPSLIRPSLSDRSLRTNKATSSERSMGRTLRVNSRRQRERSEDPSDSGPVPFPSKNR